MKYLISLLLILSSIVSAKDFSIVIKKDFNSALFDVTQDYDRQISTVGFSSPYNSSSSSSNTTYTSAFDYLESMASKNGSQMHLIKLNSSADTTFSKLTNFSNFSKAVSVIKTPSNGYFIGGHTADGSIQILKLSANGHTIFNKVFGTKNYDMLNNLVSLRDGGILAVGTSTSTRDKKDKLFEKGLGLSDIYLTRFTKHGRELWSKKFGTEYDDAGIDAVEANDGSIVVLGSLMKENKKEVSLMRISENGDKIWLKEYKADEMLSANKIIKLRDNNFLVSMNKQDNMQKRQIKLLKFDLWQNILIDKDIPTTYSSVIKDIKEYANSNLIAVGSVNDEANTDGLVMLIDKNLNLRNQEHYGDENFDEFNSVTILHNSQAIVVGLFTDVNSQESNMWIVKLNQDASMAQISTNIESFYKKLKKLFAKEIKAKQLSIREDLSIEFIDRALYFKAGQYKLTKKQKNFVDKFSKKLIPFLKANQEFINTLEINGHTSSEWKNTNFTNNYLNNEKLSMNRSYEVFARIFKTQNKPTQMWLTNILKGSGYSYSKKQMNNEVEDKAKSRRVSFKILLKK